MRKITLPAAILVLGLAACGSPDATDPAADASADGAAEAPAAPMQAMAMLQSADGEARGTATATEADGTVMISLDVQGVSPGAHGVHVHMTGACDGPTFESAGGHWNPANRQHGLESDTGQHAGDMPNLTVAEDGTGSLEYQLVGATFAGLLDQDGSAFIVHAGRDDQVTDPSGDSGNRIACGVFTAS